MTMREKMARAMARCAAAPDWDAMSDGFQAEWLELADAALAALEEPTEAMLEAGRHGLTQMHSRGMALPVAWRAMIGAAKGEV